MKDSNQRTTKRFGFTGWWSSRRSFIGSDDDTDHPNFEKGSWTAILFVLTLLGIGVAIMLALATQN
jgi:hypothetical protein